VRWRWAANKAVSTTSDAGTTSGPSPGRTTRSPSIADNTEIAGVIRPSPYSRHADTVSSVASSAARGPGRDRTWASSANAPPSPWLSARRTSDRYLPTTTTVIVHNTRDAAPIASSAVDNTPCTRSCENTYSGLVPTSPNTTPAAATHSARKAREVHARRVPGRVGGQDVAVLLLAVDCGSVHRRRLR
jgi:hypothetical protein